MVKRTPNVWVANVWTAMLASGAAGIAKYECKDGLRAEAPGIWPGDTELSMGGRFTAIVFLHARCTCGEATVTELVRPMKAAGGRAAAIPRVTVRVDPGGREAARCGALTSGSMVLYASDGPLKSRWSPVFGCEMGA